MPPIYPDFMNLGFALSAFTVFITPARFLFNAGYTSKVWNQERLQDTHFKVAFYETNSDKVFPDTDIKGGIAITCRNSNEEFGAIGTFTKYPELNSILTKVRAIATHYINEICYSPLSYKLSPLMLQEHPNTVGRLRTSAFTALAEIFYESKPTDDHDYIALQGLLQGKRTLRYVRRDYILDNAGTLDRYKVFVPKSNGSGALGEVLSTPMIGQPMIGQPMIGHTQTFMSIGNFATEQEAIACMKYIKTRFARTMLGVLKITQDNPARTWANVPLQDFTEDSDIDWFQSIDSIDEQLFAKYGLDEDTEVAFIKEKVQTMD